MSSPRYRLLVARISELRRHLLPNSFDPTGSYSEEIYDRARAFRLLAHAEVESYIEDRVVEVANDSFSLWRSTGQLRPSLIALLAFEETARSAPTSILSPPEKPAAPLDERLKRAHNSFNHYVRTKNNGVREANILRLLLPVAINESDLDLQWLASLDAWARERGEFAHASKKVKVKKDPKMELDNVRLILRGLQGIDKLLESC